MAYDDRDLGTAALALGAAPSPSHVEGLGIPLEMPLLGPGSWPVTPAAVEAFRTLALTVDGVMADRPLQTVAVLSAEAGDGRSLVAEMLARALSEICPPVRLLDADPFRRAAPTRSGLLRRWRRRDEVETNDALTLERPAFARVPLARGVYNSQAAFLVDVRAALEIEAQLGARVIVDVPACGISSIGFAVARLADAAVYVVRSGRADVARHQAVLAQAELLEINVLGLVVNEG